MSTSIGPIHFWLYKKIQFQETAVESLFKIENISSEVDVNCGVLPLGKLEDLIDSDNIHGWLQERIIVVEKRLAYATSKLIEKGYTISQLIECIVSNIKVDVQEVDTAIEAYTLIDKYLLNGMPCDGINKVISEKEEEVIFTETKQIHNEFWDLINGDISNYYLIRKAMSNVVLSKTKFILDINSQNEFVIKLKEIK